MATDGGDIPVLEFDDAQKAAITAALWAVAEEMDDTRVKHEIIPFGDDEVIELLSDSNDSEECEIFGTLTKPDEDVTILKSYLPNPIQKTELNIKDVNIMQEAVSNDLAVIEPDVSTSAIFDLTADDVEINTNAESVLQEEKQSTIEINRAAGPVDGVIQPDKIGNSSPASSNWTETPLSFREVIDLGDTSSDGEETDGETETKLISLIESDSECETDKSNSSSAEKRKTINLLIHYICPECNVDCGSKKRWHEHLDSAHDYSKILKLNIETVIDKDGKLCYQCKDCTKRFESAINFQRILQHRITHLPYAAYVKCRLCQKLFRHRWCVRKHLMLKHEKICKQYITRVPRVCYAIEYYCPLCNKKLKSRKSWDDHLEGTHDYSSTLEDKVQAYANDVVICRVCDKKFRRRAMKYHVLSHEKYSGFKCKLCDDFKTYSIPTMMHHIRGKHMQKSKRSYSCKYCDEIFEKQCEQKKHLANKHIVKWAKCEVCDKKFSSAGFLLSHMSFYNHRKLK